MITLKDIRKTYRMGDNEVRALAGVSFSIESGDYVAIMGPSGSGKSTLMHVLGLLDVPDSGAYTIGGQDVSGLSEDELAVIRRKGIGFIFQQFNLLSRMSAVENVALPLLYSQSRIDLVSAGGLLEKVGLGPRREHRPNELSGGQQQRVAIARSLVNRPLMILADEPTGNLDSNSEKEILGILRELNEQGITVVVVTHEEEVGQQAKRLIRMRDGLVRSDERLAPVTARGKRGDGAGTTGSTPAARPPSRIVELREYARQGVRTLIANKVRTALSMLGILIGVASVVAMLAIGRGAREDIESRLASMGSNLLVLRAGALRVGGVAQESGATGRINLEDVQALRERVQWLKHASPAVNGRGQITFENRNWSTQINGVSSSYEQIRAATPERGRFFTEEENRKRERVALLGSTVVREVFGERNPVGETVKINRVAFRIIGILPEKGAQGWRDQDDVVVVPVLTAMHRLLGKTYVDSVDLEVADPTHMEDAEEEVLDVMNQRHRVPASLQQNAFELRNMAELQAALSESSRTMSLLLASIAAISLLVGGIGIMNIMLVSVTERTREIGLRKAIGARRKDILAQFLAESVVVTTIGGVAGIVLGWAITALVTFFAGWSTSVSAGSVALAFGFSVFTGVAFGIYPARKASMLSPIEALRSE